MRGAKPARGVQRTGLEEGTSPSGVFKGGGRAPRGRGARGKCWGTQDLEQVALVLGVGKQ